MPGQNDMIRKSHDTNHTIRNKHYLIFPFKQKLENVILNFVLIQKNK